MWMWWAFNQTRKMKFSVYSSNNLTFIFVSVVAFFFSFLFSGVEWKWIVWENHIMLQKSKNSPKKKTDNNECFVCANFFYTRFYCCLIIKWNFFLLPSRLCVYVRQVPFFKNFFACLSSAVHLHTYTGSWFFFFFHL